MIGRLGGTLILAATTAIGAAAGVLVALAADRGFEALRRQH